MPAELRPLLAGLAEGRAAERYLFECQRPHERAAHKPHVRGWVIDQVHREVPRVTAHAMRGLLATLTAERGLAGHLIAATLGHEDERITMHAYAAPGSVKAGARRLGLAAQAREAAETSSRRAPHGRRPPRQLGEALARPWSSQAPCSRSWRSTGALVLDVAQTLIAERGCGASNRTNSAAVATSAQRSGC